MRSKESARPAHSLFDFELIMCIIVKNEHSGGGGSSGWWW